MEEIEIRVDRASEVRASRRPAIEAVPAFEVNTLILEPSVSLSAEACDVRSDIVGAVCQPGSTHFKLAVNNRDCLLRPCEMEQSRMHAA